MQGATFIDWITASQFHPDGGLPIITGGLVVHYDASGVARFERNCAAGVSGSFSTSVRVGCDGFRVAVSGNVGRFGRPDNLFNFGLEGTVARANRILASCGLPPFTAGADQRAGAAGRGAVVSRLDITANFATGSESQARALVRWLSTRAVARVKRGFAGDESVWWANSRHMFKAYIKHVEMVAHGAAVGDQAVAYCRDRGVVRVEVEVKKRLLSELHMNDLANLSDDRIADLYRDQTEVLRRVDRSDEHDILDAIPVRSRAYASAWLAGQDVRTLCSRRTLFRHAKTLREFGLNIMEPRNVAAFPVKVRVVELEPLAVPDWYALGERAA